VDYWLRSLARVAVILAPWLMAEIKYMRIIATTINHLMCSGCAKNATMNGIKTIKQLWRTVNPPS